MHPIDACVYEVCALDASVDSASTPSQQAACAEREHVTETSSSDPMLLPARVEGSKHMYVVYVRPHSVQSAKFPTPNCFYVIPESR
jgi:hypothetical protein